MEREKCLRLGRKINTFGKSQTEAQKSFYIYLETNWECGFLFQPLASSLDQQWE